MTTFIFSPSFFVKRAHRTVKKKLNSKKKFCINVSFTEKRRGRKTYSDLLPKQIDVDCDKEMEPSSPLIYNRRDVPIFHREKRNGYCYLDTEYICNTFYLFITHGNFENIFLAFLRITSLTSIYISDCLSFPTEHIFSEN